MRAARNPPQATCLTRTFAISRGYIEVTQVYLNLINWSKLAITSDSPPPPSAFTVPMFDGFMRRIMPGDDRSR